MGAFDAQAVGASGWRRLWKGTGVVMAVYSVLLLVEIAGVGGDLLQPLKGLSVAGSASTPHGLVFERIKGSTGLEAELRAASAQSRPFMLDFYADWCISCNELEKFTSSDPDVQAELAGVVLLQADVTANGAQDQALLKELNLFGPPAILFFGPNGQEQRNFRAVGYMAAAPFTVHATRALDADRRVAGRSSSL